MEPVKKSQISISRRAGGHTHTKLFRHTCTPARSPRSRASALSAHVRTVPLHHIMRYSAVLCGLPLCVALNVASLGPPRVIKRVAHPILCTPPEERPPPDDLLPPDLQDELEAGRAYGNEIRDRFMRPRIDDPGLPFADSLVCVCGSLFLSSVALLGYLPRPSWLYPLLPPGVEAVRGVPYIVPALSHGAGLAACWILGALAAQAFEEKAYMGELPFGCIRSGRLDSRAAHEALAWFESHFDPPPHRLIWRCTLSHMASRSICHGHVAALNAALDCRYTRRARHQCDGPVAGG